MTVIDTRDDATVRDIQHLASLFTIAQSYANSVGLRLSCVHIHGVDRELFDALVTGDEVRTDDVHLHEFAEWVNVEDDAASVFTSPRAVVS